jgi:hypothetical protein
VVLRLRNNPSQKFQSSQRDKQWLTRPQSYSVSRFIVGAFAFCILSQSGERPERLGRILALRHNAFNAFKAELAGVPKHGLAFTSDSD